MNLGSLIGYLGLDTKDWDQGLDKAQSGLANFAKKGAVAAAAAGVGIAAAVTGAVVAGMNIEAANDKLAAQLGASGQYAADLGKIAGSLYANAYGGSLEEVNVALRGVMQSGAVMEDASNAQIEGITAKVLDLATAFDQDLGVATQAVGQLVRTGMAKDADEALDVITRGMQQGADKAGDLLDVLNEYGGSFRVAGLDASAATGLMVQGLGAGARSADEVADAVREVGIRITDASASDAITDLGLNFEDVQRRFAEGGPAAAGALDQVMDKLRGVEDPATRAALAIKLGGSMAENMGTAFTALDPSEAAAGLGTVEGAAAKMGQTLNDNASTNIESFKRQATEAFVNIIGGKVLPLVTSFASTLATQFGPAVAAVGAFLSGTLVPALQSAAQWIAANQTPIMIVAGLITAVFLPGLIALGVQSLIAGVKSVAGWAMTQAAAVAGAAAHSLAVVKMVAGWVLMGVQSMIQGARMAAAWLIAMGPVGWVIAAVVGLVALIVANWDTVVSWTKTAWSAVTGAIGAAWDWIKGAVKTGIDFLVNLFLNFTGPGLIIKHWDSIVAFTRNAWNAVTGAVSGAWNSVTGAISSGISTAVNFVRELPGKILGALGNLGSTLYNSGRDMIQGLLNGAGSLLRNIGRFFLDLVPGWIRGPFEAALGINSPSKVFAGYGKNIGQGLINGMAGMQPAVAAQMMKLADTRALAGLMPNGVNRVQLGDVSQGLWDQLLGSGWKGRAGDKAEALYRPADQPAPAAAAPLFHADQVTVIEGTPQDVAQELMYRARTQGRG